MARCLNQHPRVAAFGESEFWGRLFVPPDRDGRYGAAEVARVRELWLENPLDSTIGAHGPGWMEHVQRADLPKIIGAAIDALTVPVDPGTLFDAVCRAIARAEGKQEWVEKTPRHVNWVDRILAYLPESRFVVMIREPYSFLLSYKHQGDRKPKPRQRVFERRYHPLGVALIWRANMRAALSLAARHPDQALLIDQRDVRERPGEVLDRVQVFLGLERVGLGGLSEAENTSFVTGARPELQPTEIFWVNLVARREMAAAGIDRLEAPLDFWGLSKSLLEVPLWALRALRDLRMRTEAGTLAYVWRWLKPR